jgi:hypothetical protein
MENVKDIKLGEKNNKKMKRYKKKFRILKLNMSITKNSKEVDGQKFLGSAKQSQCKTDKKRKNKQLRIVIQIYHHYKTFVLFFFFFPYDIMKLIIFN